jgi:hypothetical protein
LHAPAVPVGAMTPRAQSLSSSDDQPNAATSSAANTGSSSAGPQKSSRPATPNLFASLLHPTAASVSMAASQPMAKSNSSGSNPSVRDVTGETASPYGTRSRNRTGQARPNYAEDKDIDMELFESYPERKEEGPKKSSLRQSASLSNAGQDSRGPTAAAAAATAAATASATTAAAASARKRGSSEEGKNSPLTAAKDQGPASQTSSTTPPASVGSSQPSKKRKATAQPSSGGGPHHFQSQLTAQVSAANGSLRRAGGGFPETNMLSFDNCNAKPKHGKLVADDGTVLEVNGRDRLIIPSLHPNQKFIILYFIYILSTFSFHFIFPQKTTNI